jgi:hypothetical protein
VIELRRDFEMIGKGDVDDLPKESLYRARIANEYDIRDKLGFVKPAVDDFTSHRHKNLKLQRMTTERSKPFPPPSSHLPPNRLNTKMIDPMRRPRHPVRPRPDPKHSRQFLRALFTRLLLFLGLSGFSRSVDNDLERKKQPAITPKLYPVPTLPLGPTQTSNSASSLPTPPTSSTVCVGHGTLSGQVPIASTPGRSLTPMKRATTQLPAITD